MRKLIIHLLSESSGQTVKHATNTALAQFSEIEVKKYHWPMTRNLTMLNEVLTKVKKKPGIILYTIANKELRNRLKKFSIENKLPAVSVVSKIVNEISEYIGIHAAQDSGMIRKFEDNYFDKVEAIEYSLRHDDGQNLINLAEAQIVLIGPSRTSKTPTSVYLAYNGFKTANIPYIYNCNFPPELLELNNSMIVGLTINPQRLIEIRESRLNLLQMPEIANYTDLEIVRKECLSVKKLCKEQGWSVVDVSMRSIEETAAIIMKEYYKWRKNKTMMR